MSEVNDTTRLNARNFLASQQAKGGTVLNPALTAAYRYGDPDRTLNVVILSDGMTEQRERATLLQGIRERPAGSRVRGAPGRTSADGVARSSSMVEARSAR